MQTSNPTLNDKVFENARVAGMGSAMTVQGTATKALIMFGVLLMTAVWTWDKAYQPGNAALLGKLMMGGMIGGLIMVFASMFKPAWSPVIAPLYAACQGLVIGYFSALMEARYPGIVMQGVGLTFSVMFVMLMGYRTGWLQATPGLQKGIAISLIGILVFYAVVWIASLFGIAPPAFLNGGGFLGIGFSFFLVGLASLCLILDFNRIEEGARQNVEKYMEWYCALGLMVTLIWLYMEIVRLLSKLNSRN